MQWVIIGRIDQTGQPTISRNSDTEQNGGDILEGRNPTVTSQSRHSHVTVTSQSRHVTVPQYDVIMKSTSRTATSSFGKFFNAVPSRMDGRAESNYRWARRPQGNSFNSPQPRPRPRPRPRPGRRHAHRTWRWGGSRWRFRGPRRRRHRQPWRPVQEEAGVA